MSHVQFAKLKFGPWPRHAGMEGWLKPSIPVYNRVTGEPIMVGSKKFVLDNYGYAELYLPFTDNLINSAPFTYEMRWVSGYSRNPGDRKFVLPSAVHEVSYATMVEISTGLWAPPGSSSAPPPDTIGDEDGDTSTPAPSLSSAFLTYVQAIPVSTWLIPHTLNRKPSVTLIVDDRVVYTDVYYPSDTSVTVSWPSPTTGIAHLI